MKRTAFFLLTALLLCTCWSAVAQGPAIPEPKENFLSPTGTFLFASKDGQDLYMDVYEPAEGSVTELKGRQKPSVIYIFGGGFKEGSRNEKTAVSWYRSLTEQGYRVIAIDYRLGLKDATKVGPGQIELLDQAIHMAVDDLFSATLYIIENSSELGIDPANLVISGASAGAITALQAEYDICNSRESAKVLPQGFNYAGVISFSGAILSRDGAIKYAKEPAPTLMFHGTADKLVTYNQIAVLRTRFAGTNNIVPAFEKGGYSYNVYRYKDRQHEIAISYLWTHEEVFRFLETNVIEGTKRIVDALIDDPSLPRPDWAGSDPDDLYN